MKYLSNILTIIIVMISIVTINAQVEKKLKNKFDVVAVYGSGESYVLTGKIDKAFGNPKQGDVLYSVTDNNQIFHLIVSSVMSKNGKNFTLSVFNPNGDKITNFKKSYLLASNSNRIFKYKKDLSPEFIDAVNSVFYPIEQEVVVATKTESNQNVIVKYEGAGFQMGIDTAKVLNVVIDGTVNSVQVFGGAELLTSDKSFIVRVISKNPMVIPNVDFLNAASVVANGPSKDLPFVYDEKTNPQVQLIGINGNAVVIKIADIQFSNWVLKLNF